MSRVAYFVISLLLLSIYGCNTPAIQSKTPDRLYIASDFLTPADSGFFKDFRKKEQIKIIILPMSADSIVAHYRAFKYNSKFDAVVMNSVYALDVLSNNKVLHTIPNTHLWKDRELCSPQEDWMILGIDPYVIGGVDKATKTFQYNELTYGKKWKKELDDEEMASFQSSVLFQFGRKNLNKSFRWLEKIESQSVHKNDTIETASYFLTRLSNCKQSNHSFVYPNQSVKYGAFYDGIGVGVLRHSSNYTAVLSFIEYHSNIVYNQKLANNLHSLPAQNPNKLSAFAYQNEYPLLFRCTPKKMVPLFRDLKRIRKRM